MRSKRHFKIVLGNREELLNELYQRVIRNAYPDIDFSFAVATTVPDFIKIACDSHTDLGLFMPPGNIDSDPARPDTSPQEDAVYIVRTIKTTHPIPVIVVAAHPVYREPVLAAGADCFVDIPAQAADIANAVAACLKLRKARLPRAVKPLQHPDSHHLRAAQGWLELGLPLEADKELDEITPKLRAHPEVLLVRCEVYFQAKKWDYVVTVAEALVKIVPKYSQVWINRSFALHELGRTQEAFDNLVPVVKKFRKVWMIPYNLACYCARLGRLQECEQWFKRAMAIDEHNAKRAAIDDPDLKPLWDSMSGTMWKRLG